MNIARDLRILLAIALLAGWQNALVHPIAHVDEAGAFIHLADWHDGGQRNGTESDPLCDAVAAVAACISGAAGFKFAALQGALAHSGPIAGELLPAAFLAYRSQAPPHHS